MEPITSHDARSVTRFRQPYELGAAASQLYYGTPGCPPVVRDSSSVTPSVRVYTTVASYVGPQE